jgi:4-hydroxy-2-oxoheptanedioate aldolase
MARTVGIWVRYALLLVPRSIVHFRRSSMRPGESLKERMAVNGYLLNGYCAMPSPFAAEIYSRQGWDTVTIDMEHGSIGFDGAVAILQAIAASGVVPLVRIPKVDAALIGMLLDAGVLGITCAMISTEAGARELVAACKYPPRGIRSLSRVTRAALVYGPDYNARANETTSVFAMIETVDGLANLDAITAVDGIDGIYMGSVDLAMSALGRFPPATGTDPEIDALIEDATRRVAARCKSRGIIAGINATSVDAAARMIAGGFSFITLNSDVRAMVMQSRAWVDGVRRIAEGSRSK